MHRCDASLLVDKAGVCKRRLAMAPSSCSTSSSIRKAGRRSRGPAAYFEWQGTSTSLTATPIHAVISSTGPGTQDTASSTPVKVEVVYGSAKLLDAGGQPATTLSIPNDPVAGINFNMEFPATGDPDDLSAVTISAGDASTSVLFHALPQKQNPMVTVLSPAPSDRISLGPDTSSAVPIQLKVTLAG